MTFFSLLIGKLIKFGLRLSGRTGSALPGLVVEKLNPNILQKTLGDLPGGVVIVSGTNGKTTTTKIITSLLESQGQKVLTNKTGSNFVRGIISVIVEHATLGGKLDYDVAVFEQDEAYAVKLAQLISPRGVVALNVMRDQMDRFGEIDTTAKLLQQLVASSTGWVVLNANDERVSQLKPATNVKTTTYGHDNKLQKDFLTDDQLYESTSQKPVSVSPPDVKLLKYGDGTITINSQGQTSRYDYNLGGSHNAINLAAALAAVDNILPKTDPASLAKAISELEPAFGRGETFSTKSGAEITLQLVKNPAGFLHALRMLDARPYGLVGIAINDEYADGRDVSWLWDVDFSRLKNLDVRCSGVRVADMALRLKYDEVKTNWIDPDLASFVKNLIQTATASQNIIIFCTYTAMLTIREECKSYSSEVYEVKV